MIKIINNYLDLYLILVFFRELDLTKAIITTRQEHILENLPHVVHPTTVFIQLFDFIRQIAIWSKLDHIQVAVLIYQCVIKVKCD